MIPASRLGKKPRIAPDGRVGNLLPGKDADFVVLDLDATPLIARRTAGPRTLAETLAETLFVFAVLADDRLVKRTHLMGDLAHQRGLAGDAPA